MQSIQNKSLTAALSSNMSYRLVCLINTQGWMWLFKLFTQRKTRIRGLVQMWEMGIWYQVIRCLIPGLFFYSTHGELNKPPLAAALCVCESSHLAIHPLCIVHSLSLGSFQRGQTFRVASECLTAWCSPMVLGGGSDLFCCHTVCGAVWGW